MFKEIGIKISRISILENVIAGNDGHEVGLSFFGNEID
jgi:hypothetical protein